MDLDKLQAKMAEGQVLKKISRFLKIHSIDELMILVRVKLPEAVVEIAKDQSEEEIREVTEEAQKIARKLEEGLPIAEVFDVNPQLLERVYSEGHRFYESGLYNKASSRFGVLTFLSPKDPKYLFASAACLQRLKKYEDAIKDYGRLAEMTPKVPLPFFYMYECHMQLERFDDAKADLENLYKRASASALYQGQAEKARIMLEGHLARFGAQK